MYFQTEDQEMFKKELKKICAENLAERHNINEFEQNKIKLLQDQQFQEKVKICVTLNVWNSLLLICALSKFTSPGKVDSINQWWHQCIISVVPWKGGGIQFIELYGSFQLFF